MRNCKAQGMIEFVFIIPLLILILFAIVELTVFLRTVNIVQTTATEASVAASRPFVNEWQNTTTFSATGPTYNRAVAAAVDVFLSKIRTLGVDYDIDDFNSTIDENYGNAPYSKFRFESKTKKEVPDKDNPSTMVTTPELAMNIDYSNPYKNGVILDVSYVYSTLFFGAEFSIPGSSNSVNKVVILPRTMEIKSVPVHQPINY